jgi:TRAP transporter TAXI family solute receptor
MKRFNVVVALLAAFTFAAVGLSDVTAKSSSGGGSSFGGGGRSSFSSAPSSHSSYSSKPSLSPSSHSAPARSTWGGRSGGGTFAPKPTTAASTTASTDKYAKPMATKPTTGGAPVATAKPTATKTSFEPKSKFDSNVAKDVQKQKSANSLDAYKKQQAAFKQPEPKIAPTTYTSNPIYSNTKVYGGYNSTTHYAYRDKYYGGVGYRPPVYINTFAPGYGMWDTVFLVYMLDNMNRNAEMRQMAYNNQNDPGMRAWRQQAEKEAATNADLKKKLDAMDADLKKMKDEGVKVDPNFVPKGIPAEAMLSATVLKDKQVEQPTIKVATGPAGGNYYSFAGLYERSAKGVKTELVSSGGSFDNLRMLTKGDVDMAIVQSDVLAMIGKELKGEKLTSEQTVLYPEPLQLFVPSSVSQMKDLIGSNVTVYLGPKGSGSEVSWKALCEAAPAYGKVQTKNAAYADAIRDMAKSDRVAIFLVAGLNSPIADKINEIAKKKSLKLIPVYDKVLADKKDVNGNLVYTLYEIEGNTYPNLQYRWYWFNRTVETLGANAVLVVRSDWVKHYGPEAMDLITFGVLEAKEKLLKKMHTMKATTR